MQRTLPQARARAWLAGPMATPSTWGVEPRTEYITRPRRGELGYWRFGTSEGREFAGAASDDTAHPVTQRHMHPRGPNARRPNPFVLVLTWLAALLVHSLGSAARASDAAEAATSDLEAIRIEYEAPAGCPSAGEFKRRVFARTGSARLVAEGEQARVFRITLRRTSGGITGTLVILEPNGSSMERAVTGEHCSELATVLALASALAIDPRAELAPDQQLEEGEYANAPWTPEQSEPASESPSSRAPPPAAAPPASPSALPSVSDAPQWPTGIGRSPRTRRQWHLALGARGAFGLSPAFAPGATALLSVAGERSAWGVELAATVAYPAQVNSGRAQLRYWVARPQWCPWFAEWAGRLTLGPCLVAEVGTIEGRASQVAGPRRHWRVWVNLELAARLRWLFAKPWFVELDAGVGSPITRYHFIFTDPETTVYEVPVINTTLAVRLGYRF